MPDGVVLWTRLAPDPLYGGGMPDRPMPVQWQIAADERLTRVVARGTSLARPEEAHSVHVEVSGLEPGREYFYRFKAGSEVSPVGPQQRPVPGARMALLAEVFALVERYRAHQVDYNVETKVEAAAPEETAPREQFVQVVAREVREAKLLHRVSIQSFDWGALMRMREVEPRLPIVALANGDFLQVGQPGASPWLGGIDIDDFGGDLVAAADSFGADAISPVHGMPQGGRATDPGYRPYTTPELVARAHEAGMAVIPWTVNDTPRWPR